MHIPSLSLSSKSKQSSKKWFYSLDPQSQHLLANYPTTTYPPLQELRSVTGTEPVYYIDAIRQYNLQLSDPSSKASSPSSSFDTPRPQVQRAATTKSDVAGKQEPRRRTLSFTPKWSSKGKGSENPRPVHLRTVSENLVPSTSSPQRPASSLYSRTPSALHLQYRTSLSSSYSNHHPARPSPLRNTPSTLPLSSSPSPPSSPSPTPSPSSSSPSNPFLTPPASSTSSGTAPIPHPHHSRLFHAKNLRCQIHTGPCPLCAESCCAYRKAVDVFVDMAKRQERPPALSPSTNPNPTANPNPNPNPNPKTESQKSESKPDPTQLRALKTLIKGMREGIPPQDRDLRSFIRCSECARWVCPGCIGGCPVVLCGDMVCRGCKVDPWGECEWHEGGDGGDGGGDLGDFEREDGDFFGGEGEEGDGQGHFGREAEGRGKGKGKGKKQKKKNGKGVG